MKFTSIFFTTSAEISEVYFKYRYFLPNNNKRTDYPYKLLADRKKIVTLCWKREQEWS